MDKRAESRYSEDMEKENILVRDRRKGGEVWI